MVASSTFTASEHMNNLISQQSLITKKTVSKNVPRGGSGDTEGSSLGPESIVVAVYVDDDEYQPGLISLFPIWHLQLTTSR